MLRDDQIGRQRNRFVSGRRLEAAGCRIVMHREILLSFRSRSARCSLWCPAPRLARTERLGQGRRRGRDSWDEPAEAKQADA